MIDTQITLNPSRVLAYTDIGEPDWPCVLFFHGAPSGRLRLGYLEKQFIAKGVRVISPDRPGYGRSTPVPGRTLMDWPGDVAALADQLGLERFVVAGHSSGGAYALACAAALGSRVKAAITLGGVTDLGWSGAREGYLESETELMGLPDEKAAIALCVQRFGEDGSGFMAASGLTPPEPDEQLYADEQIALLLASARAEAFRQGVIGYAQDVFIQGHPWSFDPSRITTPVQVMHGAADNLVPLAHSRHTAEVIPGAVLKVLPGHGHFAILGELPETLTAIV